MNRYILHIYMYIIYNLHYHDRKKKKTNGLEETLVELYFDTESVYGFFFSAGPNW